MILSYPAAAQKSDYQRGVELFESGQPAAAVPLLTRATQQHPDDAHAWKALGVAWAAQANYQMAEPAFQRACRIAPSLEDACYYYGRALYALDRYEQSLDVLAKAGPDSRWEVRLGIAQSLEALGRAAEAETDFQKAISMSKDRDPQPGTAYGRFLVRQGRFSDAVAPLENVLKRFPRAAEAHIHLARALLEKGQAESAAHHLEQAIAVQPNSAQAHLLLAKAYSRQGRTADAESHYQAARGLSP